MKHDARGTTHEARILVMAMVAASAAVALAMPTQQELKKVQPMVAELMAPTMDDFKAKKKTAADVADMAVKYAGEAETEAAKFMLYRSSVPYYVRGEAYDKAADAVELMKTNVKDVPASVIEEIISKATVRATAKKAPRLFELYRQAKAQSVAEKDIVAFRAKLRKNPGSLPTQRNLAEALATSGDWDAALKEFAKLKDGAAQIAKKELDGSAKSAELGEFWWSYKPTYENADDTFEMHAAVHYRKALAAGEITGLKKNIVEQRIAKYGAVEALAGGQGTGPRTPAATGLYCVIDLSGGPDAKKYPVSYLNDMPKGGWSDEYKTTKLVLRRIEPGAFMMGSGNDRHQEKMDKPFYLGVFEVTQKQWELVMGTRPSYFGGPSWRVRPVDQISYDTIRGKQEGSKWPESDAVDGDSFLGIVRQKSGQRFDLPTHEQWEYACRAGAETDFYNGKTCVNDEHDSSLDGLARYAHTGGWNESWGANNNKSRWDGFWKAPDRNCETTSGTAAVGAYQPNRWGLHDMLGNVREWCLQKDERGMNLGGCWIDGADACKVYSVNRIAKNRGRHDFGLRLCLPLAGGAAVQAPVATTPSTGSIELKTGGSSPFTVKGNEATLTLPNREVIEFVRCPAGKFRMFRGQGASSDVTISRAFWMSKTPLTGKAAANAVGQDVKANGRYCAFGSQFGSERVISWLQNSYSSFLPKGAVLRQPSIAELQYAFCANGKSADATYNLFTKNEDIKVKIFCDYKGERKTAPNAWGFYDFSGLEYVLDRIGASSVTSWEHKESGKMRMLPEPSNMTDAFYWTDADVSTQYIVHRDVWWCSKNVGGPFHLIIGPDLVSEWKAKNGKK